MKNQVIGKKKIVNVLGDGNCFYRALALTLGMNENGYSQIKSLLYDYLAVNEETFNYLDNYKELKEII